MKNIKITTILILFIGILGFSCSEDEDVDKNASIIGTWTFESLGGDVTVDGTNMYDYLVGLGYPENVATQYKSGYEQLGTQFSGIVITFKADGTFTVGSNTGKYTMSGDNKILTFEDEDPGEEGDSYEVRVLTGSSLTLVVEDEDTEDFNDDDIDEIIKISLEITFKKS
ncbi:MAG: DUF4923 family protein [Cyclobacteriaceae bacterium]